MPTSRPRTRWRAGATAALYLIAFGIVAGGSLLAVGILFLLFAGVLFGGGILAVFVGLGLFWYTVKEGGGGRAPR